MNVRVVRRRFDLLLGDVAEIVAVRDVVANASIEENGLLTDETQLATKQLQIPLANVFIISKLRPYVYSYHTLKNTFFIPRLLLSDRRISREVECSCFYRIRSRRRGRSFRRVSPSTSSPPTPVRRVERDSEN